jgi:hypothetical protein
VEKSAGGMRVKPERRASMPAHLADAIDRSYARYTPEAVE